ncbi:MAG TPA: hypothetical protein VEV17_01445 [Bryobacteraceae bacterium]|nr:hypothetical protein [Bryobacteraceae bacterium]
MQTGRSMLRLSAHAPVLTLGLALCFAYLSPANKLSSASAQVTSPNGSYGVLVNQWKDPNSNSVEAVLAVLNFDGAGNIAGTYTLTRSINFVLATGTLTGTYSGNPDGSNTVNLTFDIGATVTAVMAVTDGGAGLQLLATGGNGSKPGQVVSGTGRIQSAQGTMPAGSYGFLLNQWPDSANNPDAIAGVMNLDGAGNVSGSFTAIGADVGPAPISGTATGTYSVNPDGTGSLTLSANIGVMLTFSIVVTDGGSGILMLQTAESDGFSQVVSGIARLQ